MTTLLDYWNKLNEFDWDYTYADGAERAGRSEIIELKRIAKESPEHCALYDAFYAHKFSGPAYGIEKLPKPSRPAMSGLDVGRVA